jgi:hypothetical protein
MAMAQLEYFLYVRGGILWSSRRLPSVRCPEALLLLIFVPPWYPRILSRANLQSRQTNTSISDIAWA